MILCSCEGVSVAHIRALIQYGAKTLTDIGRSCGAGIGCKDCHRDLLKLIKEETKPVRTSDDRMSQKTHS